MLTLAIALATFSTGLGQGEGGFFPAPVSPGIPPFFSDRTLFTYRGSEANEATTSQPDWSKLSVPALKPDAVKMRVLLLVAERDFSDPEFCNVLEMNDKQRLLLAMRRLPQLFQALSKGNINLEVIPRFIPEPLFSPNALDEYANLEYNKAPFDADDKEERGPFDAVLKVSSSGSRTLANGVLSFCRIGGPGESLSFEEALANEIGGQIEDRLQSSVPRYKPGSKLRIDSVLGRSVSASAFLSQSRLSQDEAISIAETRFTSPLLSLASATGVTGGPVKLDFKDGVMTYTENSIQRWGAAFLPQLGDSKGQTFSFKVRTKSFNPLAIGWLTKAGPTNSSSFGVNGEFRCENDGSWQTVSIPIPQGALFPIITPPESVIGRTRAPHEVIVYEFKEFSVGNAAPSVRVPEKKWDFTSSEGIEDALKNGDLVTRRKALVSVLNDPEKYGSVRKSLESMTAEIDGFLAYFSVKALAKVAPNDQALKDLLAKLVSTSPTESAREAALESLVDRPELTTFELVAPNTVRRSWRTRIAALKSLAALDRTDLKAKPAARQLLLAACNQELASVRMVAISALKPDVEEERKQIEYSLVNDPSEAVRLQCLGQLVKGGAAKNVVFGPLADDSWYVRANMAQQLPKEWKREALQQMVIDRDPFVRAAALKQFAQLDDATQPGEIQNTFGDTNCLVQFELVSGAAKGKWKLPAEVIEAVKKSASPAARKLAEGLK